MHCPACRRAFDARASARCPACGVGLGGTRDLDARVDDALAELDAALAAAPPERRGAVIDRVRDRLAPWLEWSSEAALIATRDAALPVRPEPSLDELRVRAVMAALVMAVVARVGQVARERAAVARPGVGRRAVGLARKVWSALG